MTDRQRCGECKRLLPRLKSPPPMVDVYGAALRLMRQSMGWTQEELAELLGVAPLTVTRWERDLARPHRSNLDRIHRLAKANGRIFR